MVLEYGVIQAAGYTGISGRCGQVLVVLGQLIAYRQTLFVFVKSGEAIIIGQLLAAGLDGEVGLTIGDDRFAWVAVLHDQVAGVAGQADVRHLAPCTGADLDHCEDVLNMVLDRVAAAQAGLPRTCHHRGEVTVLGVAQHLGQLPGQPELVALGIHLAEAFEGGMVPVGDVPFHEALLAFEQVKAFSLAVPSAICRSFSFT